MKHPGRMVQLLLSTVMSKPATTQYPAVKITMPDKFRGKLQFVAEKCIGCKLCMKDCPTNAIQIKKVGEKRFDCIVDCSKCIYCAQCVDSCPKKALEATGDFELAQIQRSKLVVTFPAAAAPVTAAAPAVPVPAAAAPGPGAAPAKPAGEQAKS